MYLLGYDIGSSSIKGAIIHATTRQVVAIGNYPTEEMEIVSKQDGWAEQDPELWWTYVKKLTDTLLLKANIDSVEIKAIGVAYQMHGLVLVDKDQKVLRPAIIWCDSRAVEIGRKAEKDLDKENIYDTYLNGPGNFTASKLKWVKDHEPEIYERIDKFMLPGDFIAMKLSGSIKSTVTGLSEGIFWDFKTDKIGKEIVEYFGFDKNIFPTIVNGFEIQGRVSSQAAEETGLTQGTPISYRAGDQPNNALALSVYESGQVAASAGTSGVIYAIIDHLSVDAAQRVNSFAHVNHSQDDKRIGVLLCINGTGIQYAWLKKQVANNSSYSDMENLAKEVPVGSDGLLIFPFGNGAERMFGNKNLGAQIINLNFNQHKKAHLIRAGLEGIAFSFVYGINILKSLGVPIKELKVGNDNLFQSNIFSQTIANLCNVKINVIETNGAVGAAKAAGFGIRLYKDLAEAFKINKSKKTYLPKKNESYELAYSTWEKALDQIIQSAKEIV